MWGTTVELQPWKGTTTNNIWTLSGVQWKAIGDMCVGSNSTGYLELQTCDGRASQLWDWDSGVAGRLRQSGTNKCANVLGGGTANGTRLGLYPCGVPAYANEQFATTALGEMKYAGKCLDVDNYYPVSGAAITIWDCPVAGAPKQYNELFHLTGTVRQGWYGDCLDIWGGVSDNYTPIDAYPCVAGAPNQKWDIYF